MRSSHGKIGNRGFVGIILSLVAALLILSAFKVNLRGYVDASPEKALDSNVVLIIETGKIIWTDYIKKPVYTAWNGYVMPFVRGEFLSGLKTKLKNSSTLPPESPAQ